MSYQSDIFDAIRGSAALVEVIAERFSWDIADGATPAPYLVAQTVSGDSDTTHDGNRTTTFPLVQFTCWATGKETALAVMAILKNEIEGVELPGSSGASLTYSGENSTYDRESKLYGEIIDYRVSCTIT